MTRLIPAIVTTVVLLASTSAQARIGFEFTLGNAMYKSVAVVRGRVVDGRFQVDQVLYGQIDPAKARIDFDNTDVLSDTGRSPKQELVVFLLAMSADRFIPWLGEAGYVVIDGDDVIAAQFTDRFGERTAFRRLPVGRAEFEKSLQAAIDVRKAIDTAAAQPRGEPRAAALIQVLLDHESADSRQPGFATYQVGLALRPVDGIEQQYILRRLQQSKPADMERLLRMATETPLNPSAFDTIAPLTSRDHPEPVRRAALTALERIDRSRINRVIAPMLTSDDPLLSAALDDLTAATGEDGVRTAHALARLLAQTSANQPANLPVSIGQLLTAIERCMHPRLIEPLYEIASDPNHPWHDNAMRSLCNATRVDWPKDRAVFDQWFVRARPVLSADYDLATTAGQAKWFAAYNGMGHLTRSLLVMSWRYDRAPNEAELLEAARDLNNFPAVGAALQEMWRRQRLSPLGEQKVVDWFWTFELKDAGPDKNDPDRRNVAVVATPMAPLPDWCRLHYRVVIAFDAEPVMDKVGMTMIVREGGQPITLDTRWSAGSPVVKALVRVWREDPADYRKELWSFQRELGPLVLREAP